MGTRSRGVGQHHGNLRQALLDAALALVEEGEVDKLTLRGVARRAGVSPAAPYHHFADKRALLVAVAADGFGQLGRELDAPEESEPERVLARMAANYVRFALAHGAHYRVMFRPDLGAGPAVEAVADDARSSFARLVAAVGAVAATRGEVTDEEVRRRAVMAWSAAHGAVHLALGERIGLLEPSLGPSDALAEAIGRTCVVLALGSSHLEIEGR